MRLRTKKVRQTLQILDIIVAKYKEVHPKKKRDWTTYEERLMKRLRVAFDELRPLIRHAVANIQIVTGETRGTKQKLTLEQKVLILLLKHLFGKSNRNMSVMLVLFSWLSDIRVSYKTIERLYSDDLVKMVLMNLHILLLKRKGVTNVVVAGDGTGYSLTIKKHYSSIIQKLKEEGKTLKKQFLYSFIMMDIDSRMYIGFGSSLKSEKEAFNKASEIVKNTGIKIEAFNLDRYYSNQADIEFCHKELGASKVYFIPKKDVTVRGSKLWNDMLKLFVIDTYEYLEHYFKRNNAESAIAEDKKRVGWTLGQKKPNTIDTANCLTCIWHNLFWLA
jgi:transposase